MCKPQEPATEAQWQLIAKLHRDLATRATSKRQIKQRELFASVAWHEEVFGTQHDEAEAMTLTKTAASCLIDQLLGKDGRPRLAAWSIRTWKTEDPEGYATALAESRQRIAEAG